jgi:endonuclease/exonuclease/phosphatase family protein
LNVRIATWNLDEASTTNKTRASHQIEQIRKIDADIWILTETSDLIDLTHLGYAKKTNKIKNGYGKYYSAIWSKYPINRRVTTYDEETAVCCEIQILPDKKIIVYGTIITYLSDKGSSGKSKYAEEHYKEILNQGRDWKSIIEQESPEIFCVAGDFNQPRDGSSWYSAHAGNKKGVEELTHQLSVNDLECLTAEDFVKSEKLQDRHSVDHVCITQNTVNLYDVGVWQGVYGNNIKLSDHNGVYVDLSIE